MFSVLEGEVEVTFRGETMTARSGETINVPANAPHAFRNVGDQPARLLCLCSPAGQDEFFLEVGQRVGTRTEAPEPLDQASEQEFRAEGRGLGTALPNRVAAAPSRRRRMKRRSAAPSGDRFG